MKNILSFILLLSAVTSFAGKDRYPDPTPWANGDFEVVQYQQGARGTVNLLVKTIGTDITACELKAKQRAIFSLVFLGASGDGSNIPAIAAMHSEGLQAYQSDLKWWDGFFGTMAKNYVKQSSPNTTPPKISGKHPNIKKIMICYHKIVVDVVGLGKYLKNENKIKSLADFGFKPIVLVVPGDAWMEKHGFVKTSIIQGVESKIFDYKNAIKDNGINTVMAACASVYGGPNGAFQITDIKAKLDLIMIEEQKNRVRNDGLQESSLDIYARCLQADLWIKVDLKETKNTSGYKYTVTMAGMDPYTQMNAIPGYPVDKTTKINDPDKARLNAVQGAANEFKSKVFDYFKNKVEKGMEGQIEFQLSDEIDMNFESSLEYADDEYKFREILDAIIGKNSNENRVNGSSTPTMRGYLVTIPFKVENKLTGIVGKNDFEKFGTLVEKKIKKLGYGSVLSTSGLGRVTVLINEKL